MQNQSNSDNSNDPISENTVRASLIAVREAGASFQSPFFLESNEFEKLVLCRDDLLSELAQLKNAIIDQLFILIESSTDNRERRQLLNLKRNVYNRRTGTLSALSEVNIPPEITNDLKRFNQIISELDNIFTAHSPKIQTEIEMRCNDLLEDIGFRLALDYSCPYLLISKSKTKFKDWLRNFTTVYAYSLKHVTKTPPSFTFCRVYLPESAGHLAPDTIETILNIKILSVFEKQMLKTRSNPSAVRLAIVPNWCDSQSIFFLVIGEIDVRILRFPLTAILKNLSAIFKQDPSIEESFVYKQLFVSLPEESREAIVETVEKLKKDLIIYECLLENVADPYHSLQKLMSNSGQSDDRQKDFTALWQLHGQVTSLKNLPAQHSRITKTLSESEVETDRPYFVYNYAGNITQEQENLSSAFIRDLRPLTDIFCVTNVNGAHRLYLHELINTSLAAAAKTKVALPELISRILFAKSKNRENDFGHEKMQILLEQINRMRREINQLPHNIDDSTIGALQELLPPDAISKIPLSIVGVVDFQTPRFYLHNIFGGNSRFTSKYLLSRKFPDPAGDDSDETIDVEVVPSWNVAQHNINHKFQTGFSFDGRCRSLFKHFIEIEDIVATWNKAPVFFHRRSNRKLRFHYRGLGLLRSLSLPYKILLSDQADYFINIFDEVPPVCGINQVVARDRIVYKSIQLRRACVCLGINLINPFVMEKDWLRAPCLFRQFLTDQCGIKTNLLYYRLIRNGEYISTPRFLNTHHPLSWNILKRTLRQQILTDAVHFSVCDPEPVRMRRKADENYFTEFMMEV